MSNLKNYLFTSESVSEGHPDKVSDRISDMVVDSYLSKDPFSRVACETLTTTNKVVLAGEVRGPEIKKDELIQKVRNCIKDIGYDQDGFTWKEATKIESHLHAQSADIAMGVDSSGNKDEGAGDQGIMFGYACNETDELMPAPVMFAHRILRKMAEIRHAGEAATWLRPDCKSQVALKYDGGQMVGIENVVVSTQHAASADNETIRSFITEEIIKPSLPPELLTTNTQYLINPTGRFVIGGPEGDSGLTGRKIIVDTYGGWGRHGGGAFSGKDPSKVDRSAAYMCRWVAKNIVAAELAERVEIQAAYAIGYPEPTSITIDCFGTEKVSEESIEKAIMNVFSFKPADIVSQLDLLRPIYRETTHYGHFGKSDLPWEQTNKTDALKNSIS